MSCQLKQWKNGKVIPSQLYVKFVISISNMDRFKKERRTSSCQNKKLKAVCFENRKWKNTNTSLYVKSKLKRKKKECSDLSKQSPDLSPTGPAECVVHV